MLYAIGPCATQTIGRDFDIGHHGRAARTGRVGKRHMSDLRNDVPEQLDVLPKVPGRLVGDSYDIPATRRLVMSPFLDRFSKSYIPTGTVAVVFLAAMAAGFGDAHPP